MNKNQVAFLFCAILCAACPPLPPENPKTTTEGNSSTEINAYTTANESSSSGEECECTIEENCTKLCKWNICGDGEKLENEECDYGSNNAENSICTPLCTNHKCGDGFKYDHEGAPDLVEECDDGDILNTNSCTNDCKLAFCGDGFLWIGEEECDDGVGKNGYYGNYCDYDCTLISEEPQKPIPED